jgi:hypothetical protein
MSDRNLQHDAILCRSSGLNSIVLDIGLPARASNAGPNLTSFRSGLVGLVNWTAASASIPARLPTASRSEVHEQRRMGALEFD